MLRSRWAPDSHPERSFSAGPEPNPQPNLVVCRAGLVCVAHKTHSRRAASRLWWFQSAMESQEMPECFVAKATDLKDGDRRIVVSGKHEVGVFFKDNAYFAYSNFCVHSGGPACEGLMINRVVDIIAPDRTYQGQTFSDDVHFAC